MVALKRELTSSAVPVSTDAIPLALRRRGGTPRHVLAMTVVGSLTLALFASRDLPGWAERLGDSPLVERVRPLVEDWDHAMERLGVTRPHEFLRDTIRRLLDAQW
jgi:hypothetical protein